MSLPTARIPELNSLTVDLPLEVDDLIPIFIASENKTKKVSLGKLNTFFNLGGGGSTHSPVEWGGELIYKVPSSANNTDTASIPSIAGLDFSLERGGLPLEPLKADNSNASTAEFEILNAGGFKLLQSGDVLSTGEKFKLTLFSLISTTGPTSSSTGFITGKVVVTANKVLNAITEMNKLIQLRGTSSALTLTLPSVEDIPVNSFIPIEASINNTKPCTVSTTGGQYVYFNNGSKTAFYMMPGEVCWLFRDEDGFYIVNDFADKYRHIAKPLAAYKADMNQLLCAGQLLLRADHPRLWEYIQTLGSSLVNDATWLTASATLGGRTIAYPYRGCFSTGDGSTTFRVPDLMNMFLRGVKSESGSDAQRFLNKPGGYQEARTNLSNETIEFEARDGAGGASTGTIVGTGFSGQDTATGWVDAGHLIRFKSGSGGPETRPENIGVLWVINE